MVAHPRNSCNLRVDQNDGAASPATGSRGNIMARNFHDGGEAIVEAFRNMGVDYIMSSPGSEWSPVWEAMARQTVEKNAGPKFIDCWHETVAVDMALGYTAYTGKPQAVLIHAGVGLMHGSMAMLWATQQEIPMLVMSGRIHHLRRGSRRRGRAAMVRRRQRRWRGQICRAHRQMVHADHQLRHAVQFDHPRARAGAARASRPRLSQRLARGDAARMEKAGRSQARAARAEDSAAAARCRRSRRTAEGWEIRSSSSKPAVAIPPPFARW